MLGIYFFIHLEEFEELAEYIQAKIGNCRVPEKSFLISGFNVSISSIVSASLIMYFAIGNG